MLARGGVEPAYAFEDAPDEARIHIQVFFRKLPDGRRLIFVLNMDERPAAFSLRFPGADRTRPLGDSDAGASVTPQGDKLAISLREWGWSVLVAG